MDRTTSVSRWRLRASSICRSPRVCIMNEAFCFPFWTSPMPQGRTFKRRANWRRAQRFRSEEHTSELQSLTNLVCRLLLEKKNNHVVDLLSGYNAEEVPHALTSYLRTRG